MRGDLSSSIQLISRVAPMKANRSVTLSVLVLLVEFNSAAVINFFHWFRDDGTQDVIDATSPNIKHYMKYDFTMMEGEQVQRVSILKNEDLVYSTNQRTYKPEVRGALRNRFLRTDPIYNREETITCAHTGVDMGGKYVLILETVDPSTNVATNATAETFVSAISNCTSVTGTPTDLAETNNVCSTRFTFKCDNPIFPPSSMDVSAYITTGSVTLFRFPSNSFFIDSIPDGRFGFNFDDTFSFTPVIPRELMFNYKIFQNGHFVANRSTTLRGRDSCEVSKVSLPPMENFTVEPSPVTVFPLEPTGMMPNVSEGFTFRGGTEMNFPTLANGDQEIILGLTPNPMNESIADSPLPTANPEDDPIPTEMEQLMVSSGVAIIPGTPILESVGTPPPGNASSMIEIVPSNPTLDTVEPLATGNDSTAFEGNMESTPSLDIGSPMNENTSLGFGTSMMEGMPSTPKMDKLTSSDISSSPSSEVSPFTLLRDNVGSMGPANSSGPMDLGNEDMQSTTQVQNLGSMGPANSSGPMDLGMENIQSFTQLDNMSYPQVSILVPSLPNGMEPFPPDNLGSSPFLDTMLSTPMGDNLVSPMTGDMEPISNQTMVSELVENVVSTPMAGSFAPGITVNVVSASLPSNGSMDPTVLGSTSNATNGEHMGTIMTGDQAIPDNLTSTNAQMLPSSGMSNGTEAPNPQGSSPISGLSSSLVVASSPGVAHNEELMEGSDASVPTPMVSVPREEFLDPNPDYVDPMTNSSGTEPSGNVNGGANQTGTMPSVMVFEPTEGVSNHTIEFESVPEEVVPTQNLPMPPSSNGPGIPWSRRPVNMAAMWRNGKMAKPRS